MKRLVRGVLVCVLLLVAATGLTAEDKIDERPYYPLQVGTTWHYKAGDGKVVGSQHLAVNAEGVYCHDQTVEGNVTQTPKPPILLLKLPPKKGDSWKVDSTADGKTFRGTFQIDEQEVKVPADTYKAVRVTSQDLEVNGLKPVITTYYARGAGMVKQVIQENNVTTEIELEKFEAGKELTTETQRHREEKKK